LGAAAVEHVEATAKLSTSVQLIAHGEATSTATAQLLTSTKIAAQGLENSEAQAALHTGIPLSASGIEHSSATAALKGSILLAAHGVQSSTASVTLAAPIPGSMFAYGFECSTAKATISETAVIIEWVYADQQYFDVFVEEQYYPVYNSDHVQHGPIKANQQQLSQKQQEVAALVKATATKKWVKDPKGYVP
jgi:hypothetical protein